MDPPQASDTDARELVAFIAGRDVPCPVCGYGLRGIQAAICPECAAPLRLDVTSANLHLGPWSLVMVSFALGMGFDGVVSFMLGSGLVISTILQPRSPGQLRQPLMVWTTIATLGVLTTLALVLFVRRKRAWRRLPVRKQWRLAVLIFITVGVVHALGGGGMVLWLNYH